MMTRFLRSSCRPMAVAALVTALLLTAVPSASGAVAAPARDDFPTGEGHPYRRAYTHTVGRSLDLPDVDAAVRLACEPRITDRTEQAAVACVWGTDDDVAVRAWQLWKLGLRPASDGRVLATQVGADVTSHLDREVEVPGHYLYAVLGLDANGEIVARSRIESLRLAVRDHDVDVEPMALECAAHRAGSVRAPEVTVGCEWRAVTDDAAVGYVLWRQTDGGARTAIARVGLATTAVRDAEVAFGHRYAYVVTAVDGAGEVVGRSRPATVAIPIPDRPVDPEVERPVVRPEPAQPAADDPAVRPAARRGSVD
jgi:hypothetical protein